MNTAVEIPFAEPAALSGLIEKTPDSRALLVLAHGAGAGHTHTHMQKLADGLLRQGIATLRFNFPFTELGRPRADRPATAVAAIQAAVAFASRFKLPLFAGGHSFGGRMASHAAAEGAIEVAGLLFFSFPLHPAGKPAVTRAAHLPQVPVPMCFLSGTRDGLAEVDLLTSVVDPLADAEVHWLHTADHSFKILKRTRTEPLDVYDEAAAHAAAFVDALL